MRAEEGYQPVPHPEEHPYNDDPVLSSLLKRLLPSSLLEGIHADLVSFGDRLVNDIRPLSPLVQPVQLTQYDHWGRRIDTLHTSEGWRKLTDFVISNGLTRIQAVREQAEYSRLYAMTKCMVAVGDTHVILCPVSMTDGAARVIELYGTYAMKRELLPRLTSSDPSKAYLAGQWMTERAGGSDVSQTETIAVPTTAVPTDLGVPYLLTGFKWFSSAADGHLALALARTGPPSLGARSLTAFIVPLRLSAAQTPLANGVRMHRLKDKIGTKGLPTAELSLENTRAWRIGEEGAGVRTLAALLNITRLHSAVDSAGALARALAIARACARVRRIDGGRQLLCENALHVSTLARVVLLHRALVHFTMGVARLLGRVECGVASEEEKGRLRLLTPVLKGFAAMRAVGGMEDCMTALGGQGYMEETGIGRLIRDASVEKIWEGTENIMALDMMRAGKDSQVVVALTKWAMSTVCAAGSTTPHLRPTLGILNSALEVMPAALSPAAAANPHVPRAALVFVASVASAIFLLEHAIWSAKNNESSTDIDAEAVRRWVEEAEVAVARVELERKLFLTDDAQKARSRADDELLYGRQPVPARL